MVIESPREPIPLTGLKARIETPFLRESIAFYTDHLGMTVLQKLGGEGDEGAILGLSNSTHKEAFLELAYVETHKSYQGVSLQFRVGNLGVMVESLRGHWPFRGPVKRPWGSTYLYLTDPTGIQVIVYEGEL